MLDLFVGLAGVSGWILKIYSWVHIAAFIMSWINADPGNTLVSVIYRTTHPMWHWVGQRLPRNINSFAPIVALLLVIFGEIAVPGVIRSLGAVITGKFGLNDGVLNVIFYIIYGALYITSTIISCSNSESCRTGCSCCHIMSKFNILNLARCFRDNCGR